MGEFLNAAYRVLNEEGKPLSPTRITEIALAKGWLATQGKTPWQTMKSKLSTSILVRQDKSPFMRTRQGLFGLRAWKGLDLDEYIADRYQRALLEEEVVVFPASSLQRYIPGRGLHPNLLEKGSKLLAECRPMQRQAAELNFSVIQLVSVFLVRYADSLLTYKRTRRLPESRLHGAYSAIFGGHINPQDLPPLFDVFEPEISGIYLLRELKEEIRIPAAPAPSIVFRGVLYDDTRELSRQHLGITYNVFLASPQYEIGERGFLMDAKFETMASIVDRFDDFENWSQMLVMSGL